MICYLHVLALGRFAGYGLILLALGIPFQEDRPRLGKPPTFPTDLTALDVPGPGRVEALVHQPQGSALTVYPQNRKNSRAFFNTHYQGAAAPAMDWTGNRLTCSEGTTAASYREGILLRLNWFRAMAGVPAQIAFTNTFNAKSQKAALMMSVNQQLSHFPPANWLCYSADGAEAARNSNLALGAHGWDAITLYIKDPGDNNGAAGHRRWIFYPQTRNMGTGDIPPSTASNSLWVFDSYIWDPRPGTREEFVAWPPPGYVPYQVVFPRWSFSHPSANFSQAAVAMTQNQQGIPLTKETVENGYGENTIVWIPNGMSSWASWPKPTSDTRYRVTISNVIISGIPRSFTYDVIVIDPAISIITTTQDLIDFDGDTRTDHAVWRSGSGVWYTLPSNSGGFTTTQWGLPGDIPVPADYDGDRKTDIAVWRPATGVWHVLPTNAPGTSTAQQWGVSTDRPLPGDYDGDGKTDIAVWRPGSGVWYVLPSSAPGTFTATQWGLTTDIPVPGDYDGDNKTDIAVWRPGSGVWYVLPSGAPGTFTATHWGLTTDIPVPCDYDGDGKADIAVWRPDSGVWYILPSNAPGTFTSTHWGLATDTAVPADYDGDGKADIAVWRPGTGVRYVLPSNAPGTYSSTQWGMTGDLPLSPVMWILACRP